MSTSESSISIEFQKTFNTANLLDIYTKKIATKPSVGIDGVSVEKFDKTCVATLSKAIAKIEKRTFKFTPYLEEIKSKGRNKLPRVISKPTVRDRVILAATLKILQENNQESIKRELPNQIIRRIKDTINKSKSDLHYTKIDIKAFYDNIAHDKLKRKLRKKTDSDTLWLIESAITNITINSTLQKSSYPSKNEKGVPQGLSISNILSDIYLGAIDKKYSRYRYHRYVDDILFISQKSTEKVSKSIINDLEKIGLEANEKSSEGKISQGLEYLGYIFKGKGLVSVRMSSKEKFIRSLLAPITRYKSSKGKEHAKEWLTDEARITVLMETLNEKITGAISEKKRYGWIFYFIEINDIKLLHEIDSIILKQIKKAGLEDHTHKLKRLARAYREAKYNAHGPYIHNYNKYENLQDKINYLITMGVIDPDSAKTYSQVQIETLFEIKKSKNLLQLEIDLGSFS